MIDQIEYLKLYTVENEYIKDLHDNVNAHVFANVDTGYRHSRKYLGVLLNVNGCLYFAPLSSPKNSDFTMVGGRRVIRNSILPIIRITETDIYGKRHLLGTIKLSNMIPVPKCKLVLYDLDKETDEDYRNLVLKEKRFINRNKEMIIAHAETLYREKCSGTNAGRGYLKDTFDFAAFEKYITVHYSGEDME